MRENASYSNYNDHLYSSNHIQDQIMESQEDTSFDQDALDQSCNEAFESAHTIHQLQSEIDSLRRSLNQITLIQS